MMTITTPNPNPIKKESPVPKIFFDHGAQQRLAMKAQQMSNHRLRINKKAVRPSR